MGWGSGWDLGEIGEASWKISLFFTHIYFTTPAKLSNPSVCICRHKLLKCPPLSIEWVLYYAWRKKKEVQIMQDFASKSEFLQKNVKLYRQ